MQHGLFRSFIDTCQSLACTDDTETTTIRRIHASLVTVAPTLSKPTRLLARSIVAAVVAHAFREYDTDAYRAWLTTLLADIAIGDPFPPALERLLPPLDANSRPSVGDRHSHLALTTIRASHQDREFSLSAAAESANLTPFHLAHILKVHTGLTFTEHLRRARISAACALLSTTNAPIKEIAITVGYSSQSQFNRNFRRLQRMSPTLYRTIAIQLK
jgi:AraC-like DNA-binding protein